MGSVFFPYLSSWASLPLPPDVQKIIDQISEEYLDKMANLWNKIVQDGYDFFAQKGGKRHVLPKEEAARWNERVMSVTHAYVKELNSKGFPGDEVYKFAVDYLKTHQK